MPPTFKKPLEYDPSMATRTLAATYENSAEAQNTKKKHMLVELGLADEALALDDEDEDDDENSESPILTKRHNGVAMANGGGAPATLPNYGYKDVFGKEYEKRRRQLVELKGNQGYRGVEANEDVQGYEKYLVELLSRAAESLQTLRADRGLQSPGSAEVISELQHELSVLQVENTALRTQDPTALLSAPGLYNSTSSSAGAAASGDSGSHDSAAALRRLDGEVEVLRQENERLRLLLQGTAEDEARQAQDAIRQLQGQALELQLSLADKDKLIVQLQMSSGAAGQVPDAAATAKIAELQALNLLQDKQAAHAEQLERQLHEHKQQLLQQEADFQHKLAQMGSATSADQQQSTALQQSLWSLQEASKQQIADLEAQCTQQVALIHQLQAQSKEAAVQVEVLTSRVSQAHTEAAREVHDRVGHAYTQLDALQVLRQELLTELLSMQKEVFSDAMMTQMGRLVRDREVVAVRKVRAEVQTQLDAAELAAREAEARVESVREQSAEQLRIATLESQGAVKHYMEKWRAEFDRRKKLHNQVAELKGNIRVLCRVRPLVEKERAGAGGANGDDLPVRALDEETLRITGDKTDKEFEFDRVFGVEDGQDMIYTEVSGLVTSVLDGYNVCIMAYGQTGSGKTHTMEGPDADPGVYHRALTDLFRLAEDRSDQIEYVFAASTLEIYNEQIYDLLSSSKDQDDKLDVKQGPEGMHVPGLRQEVVHNIGEVAAVITRGKQNRSTFSTNMNEHSSRSHLVLSVHLTATTKATGATMRGKLHLVDLAGSERLSRTGAQGDRLKEAQAINKSLSALGDVIQALQQRNSHIPYRNSKLTRLLEDSLGGNSKTIMVVHVSPAAENVSESKCSLEFASRARKVELGKAKQNVETSGGAPNGGQPTPVIRLADGKPPGSGSRPGSPSDPITPSSRTGSTNSLSTLRKPTGR